LILSTDIAADRQLVLFDDPRLRRICRAVAPQEDVACLVTEMMRTMQTAGGVGLAAPQIGDRRRVLICRGPDDPGSAPLVMINPLIEATEGPCVAFEEGCLSFPGVFLTLRRQRAVRVRYHDLDGTMRVLHDAGLLSRIIQHEIDHLDGILFTDRLPLWRRWLWRLRRPRLLRMRRDVRGMAA
jgi:peptide deformylase